jgi:DNA-binding CsgD family transcriptional regulator
MLILKSGSIPIVEFLDTDLYKIVPKFIYFSVSSKSFKYVPSHLEIIDFYQNNKYDLAYLKGKKAHTKEAENLYNIALNSIAPDYEQLIKQYLSIASKLSLQYQIDEIFDIFLTYVPKHYGLEKEEIYDLIEESQFHPYFPKEKYVVFNPKYNLNPLFQQKIQQEEIGKHNRKIVVELAKKGYTREQIAEKANLNLKTVDEHLKKAKISTKGNKKNNTYQRVQKWKYDHPKGIQKECAKSLKITVKTVERNWKKIEKNK